MKRILIVEDQADIRDLIRMSLEHGDFEIHEAEDGDQGLQMAQRLAPDLVLLDVMMPGQLNGLAVCKRLKADPSQKPSCRQAGWAECRCGCLLGQTL